MARILRRFSQLLLEARPGMILVSDADNRPTWTEAAPTGGIPQWDGTDWTVPLPSEIMGMVSLTGNQTISGTKTFSAIGFGALSQTHGSATLLGTGLGVSFTKLFRADGLTTRAQSTTPTDGDFTEVPPDGTMVLDESTDRLYVRTNGTWKYTSLT